MIFKPFLVSALLLSAPLVGASEASDESLDIDQKASDIQSAVHRDRLALDPRKLPSHRRRKVCRHHKKNNSSQSNNSTKATSSSSDKNKSGLVKDNIPSGGSKKVAGAVQQDVEGSDGSSSSTDNSNSSASSSSTKAGPFNSNQKLGLAWAMGQYLDISKFTVSTVGSFYSWRATPQWDQAPTNVPFCSMLWGSGSDKVNDYKSNVVDAVNSDPSLTSNRNRYNKHKCTMGPNEIDLAAQANMSPQATCDLMRQYQLGLARDHGFYLMGFSTTSAPNGIELYKQFKNICGDVWAQIDAIPLHWYGIDADQFKSYVTNWHNAFPDKDIVVTEYANMDFVNWVTKSYGDVWAFHMDVAKWMWQQEYVKAFFPFAPLPTLPDGVNPANTLVTGSNPSALFTAIAATGA